MVRHLEESTVLLFDHNAGFAQDGGGQFGRLLKCRLPAAFDSNLQAIRSFHNSALLFFWSVRLLCRIQKSSVPDDSCRDNFPLLHIEAFIVVLPIVKEIARF